MLCGVVFDMDGVLFDTESISKRCMRKLAAKKGLADIEPYFPQIIGRNRADIEALLQKLYGSDFDAHGFMVTWRELLVRTVHEEGLPLKKGAREIVTYLHEKGTPTAICSSTGGAVIRDHLRQVRMEGLFDTIVDGSMVTHSKPQPDIYLKACEALGLQPRTCMGIEDSPNGLRSSHDAGLITIMVPDQVPPTQELLSLCYRKFDTLCDLQRFLQDTDWNSISQGND